MSFLKHKSKINWKYILGEILLIFIGINLAIWFNNWNSSRKINNEKTAAIAKITEEIKNNITELEYALSANHSILNAYNDFKNIYDGNTAEITTNPGNLASLNLKYPNFFRVKDSVKINESEYHYTGTTQIELQIPSLSKIAWETTGSMRISNKFSYDCLYQLESMYDLQRLVRTEIDKATDALQQAEMKKLMSNIKFMDQLGPQLNKSYTQMLEDIKDCN